MSSQRRPIRVLHALGGLGHGGIETWLMQMAPRVDAEQIAMDFLVHSPGGVHEAELIRRGCEIVTCRPTGLRRPWSYFEYPRRLRQVFRERPPYDVVHSHMQEFGGYFLRAASEAGVKTRIAHSHNGAPQDEDGQEGWLRRAYNSRLRGLVQRHATTGFACSRVAAEALFGSDWESDPRWRILHYGIDLGRFDTPESAVEMRRAFDLPKDARVVGHVGRFVPQKNHAFLIRVAAECVRRSPNVYFLLVGDGPLRGEVEQLAAQLGVADRIRFAGLRSDVPQLMMSAMDLLVLPSLWEGLPVVVLEAQAAGRPILLSHRVSTECAVLPNQVEQIDLEAGASAWAERILERLRCPPQNDASPVDALRGHGMSIDTSADVVLQCYCASQEVVAP